MTTPPVDWSHPFSPYPSPFKPKPQSQGYYECHITMVGNRIHIENQVEAIGWRFSCIDGDPVLGPGVKCYATMLYNSRAKAENVKKRLVMAAATLELNGCEVLRRKVELVIFDDKSSKVQGCTMECDKCE